MKKIILTIIIVFNFGVISDTFAATFTQDCQMQRIAAKTTGISQSTACRESAQFNENVDKVVGPIAFLLKYIFGTLLIFIAATGALAWFGAAWESILKRNTDESSSPVYGWVGLLLLVLVMIFIFWAFSFSPYGFFKWIFTIIFFGGVFYGFVDTVFIKKKKKKKKKKNKSK